MVGGHTSRHRWVGGGYCAGALEGPTHNYLLMSLREGEIWGIHHLQPAPSESSSWSIHDPAGYAEHRISSSSEGAMAADSWELGTGIAMLRSEGHPRDEARGTPTGQGQRGIHGTGTEGHPRDGARGASMGWGQRGTHGTRTEGHPRDRDRTASPPGHHELSIY